MGKFTKDRNGELYLGRGVEGAKETRKWYIGAEVLKMVIGDHG